VFAGICRLLDRVAIRGACASLREARAVFPHSQEARERLGAPDYLRPPTSKPLVQFQGRTRFSFRSSIITPWPENNQVAGRLYRAGKNWRERPAVVLLHGWNGEWHYRMQFPYLAWRLRRRGWNVAMLELPYHGNRRPTQPGAIRNFLSSDLFRMIEAVQQSLADVEALRRWLEEEGVSATGLWGISLGAWLTGMLCCQEPRFSWAILMTPVVQMELAIEQLPFFGPVRESLAKESLALEPFNLRVHRPRLAPEQMLIAAGLYDLFAPLETVVDVWQSWGRPTFWRLPHGHISMLLSRSVLERMVDWLSERAGLGQIPASNIR